MLQPPSQIVTRCPDIPRDESHGFGVLKSVSTCVSARIPCPGCSTVTFHFLRKPDCSRPFSVLRGKARCGFGRPDSRSVARAQCAVGSYGSWNVPPKGMVSSLPSPMIGFGRSSQNLRGSTNEIIGGGPLEGHLSESSLAGEDWHPALLEILCNWVEVPRWLSLVRVTTRRNPNYHSFPGPREKNAVLVLRTYPLLSRRYFCPACPAGSYNPNKLFNLGAAGQREAS